MFAKKFDKIKFETPSLPYQVVIVAGGNLNDPAGVELLNVGQFEKNQSGWIKGPTLRQKSFYGKLVAYGEKVVLFGGLKDMGNQTFEDAFYQLASSGNWVQMNQKLNLTAAFPVAFLIPIDSA
jgi:hypothetical protein